MAKRTAGWQLSELPELRPGDWAYIRTKTIASFVIRFLFKSYYNHALWIAQILKNDQGVLQSVGIIESVAKGVSPGDLWKLYQKADIVIMRADCPDETAHQALMEAYKNGRKRYDWLIPLDIIRRYGWRNAFISLIWIIKGEKVLFPHVKDRSVVCVEAIQEPYADVGFPLTDKDWLLSPDPYSSSVARPIFYGYGPKIKAKVKP